jgi:tetratricopeptide (TPR) repeat protein
MLNQKQQMKISLFFFVLAVFAGALTGCQSKQNNHEKWVDDANNRWHDMRSSLMLDMAKQQFNAGDLKQAKKSVGEGLKVDPENAKLKLLAGRISLERNELERSYHFFNGAIDSDKELAKPYYYKGIVLQRWQQYEQAKKNYEKAYKRKPDNVSYLLAKSEMLVETGQGDKAIQLLEDKRTYFDQNSTIRAALAHLYNMKNNYEQAAVLFKEASLLDPANEQLVEELGLAQLAAGQHEQAVETFEQLLAKHPNRKRGDLRRALATAYVKTNQIDQAQQTYLKLAQSDAGQARDWLHLGELSLAQDKLQSALDAANRAIDQTPGKAGGLHARGHGAAQTRRF